MARQAIRNEGEDAEREFLRLVSDSRKSKSAKRGDVTVYLEGEDWYVEVKYVTSNTVNQVRAIKFIPLVIHSPQRAPSWAVLPPQEVVRLVFEKTRGQHTELALESANLTLGGIPERFWCEDSRLRLAVHAAIKSSQSYSDLRKCMEDLLKQLRDVKAAYESAVGSALAKGDSAK